MMLQDSVIAMKPARRGPARLLGGVLSLPYLLLRSSTAGAATTSPPVASTSPATLQLSSVAMADSLDFETAL